MTQHSIIGKQELYDNKFLEKNKNIKCGDTIIFYPQNQEDTVEKYIVECDINNTIVLKKYEVK